jgi:seryl-tRNA synthetase
MLDINFIWENLDLVKSSLQNRQLDIKILDRLKKIDDQRRQLIKSVEDIRFAQNQLQKEFKGRPTPAQKKKGTDLKGALKKVEPDLRAIQEQLDLVLAQIPNLPASDVPLGKDDSENKVIKTWGKKPKFSFKPQDHLSLGEALDIIDVKRAAKVSGSRFGYFKGQGAQLQLALMYYVFQKLTKKGFMGMIPPAMVKGQVEWKMGYTSNPDLNDTYYHFAKDDLTFISSSEHSVIPYHMDEILEAKSLPLRYVNYSPCFRREAGTYGQDTRGLFRVHYFSKVEMNVFTLPDEKVSDQACLDLLALQEEIMQELKLPYQLTRACTGDLPWPNRRMYDLNAWFPGQNAYRETHSCSNCTDYQTRRLNTKTRFAGQTPFVHALNATAVTDRVLIAIFENYQQKDGSIKVPKILQKLLPFDKIKS